MTYDPQAHVAYSDTGNAVVSSLTGTRFPYDRLSAKSKHEAIQKLRTGEDGKGGDATIIAANNVRAGRTLSVRDHMRMMEGTFAPDTRPLSQQIMEDAEIRSNTVKTEDDLGGNPIRRNLDSKAWDKSPARRAMRDELERQADELDAVHAAEVEAEAAREVREADSGHQRACLDSQIAYTLIASDPSRSESEILAAKRRRDAVEAGEMSVEDYGRYVSDLLDAKAAAAADAESSK